MRSSESRTEAVARELLEIRGWNLAHPPKGQILWKNEYRDYAHISEALKGAAKTDRGGDGYPDFLVVDPDTINPLLVGETKAQDRDIKRAIGEASDIYGNALLSHGFNVLATGIAGNESGNISVVVHKHSRSGWKPIEYRQQPIQWLPTPDEASILLRDDLLFDLEPRVPPPEVLADRGDQINRILRECKIKDEFRPAVTGAFMLALWQSKGQVRTHPEHILSDINAACRKAFVAAGKLEIADSIQVPEANEKLAAKASRICYILRLMNVTTLTSAHDYLGQLYETFFRFTGGNTIGQFFTPRHITGFMTDLCEVSRSDTVVDPTCGTGGFLISALYRMIGDRNPTHKQVTQLVSRHLKGLESEPITAALCVANMILRGDGTTGIVKGDCFSDRDFPHEWASVVLGNPPFPHAKTDEPSDAYVDRALDALKPRGTLAMIVPISILIKSNKQRWRDKILKHNTLRGVIRLTDELFLPYAHPYTAILILKKGVPHSSDSPVFFCHVDNDGFRLKKNVRIGAIGEQLTDAESAFQSHTSQPGFCIWSPLKEKEWVPGLHIESKRPTPTEVKHGVSEILRGMVAFNAQHSPRIQSLKQSIKSGDVTVAAFDDIVQKRPKKLATKKNTVGGIFDIYYGQTELESKKGIPSGDMPVISSSGLDNGCHGFYDLSDICPLSKPPFVTVPRTGSIGQAFVQLIPCAATSDALVLLPKSGTDISDMFISAQIIRMEKWRFNYGSKITPARIAGFKVPRGAKLKQWVSDELQKALSVCRDALEAFTGDTEEQFANLANEWKAASGHLSSVSRIAVHPAYQRIIGMGRKAIPLILDDLREHPDHWFWALAAITGVDPVPDSDAGHVSRMTEAWLKWGREEGYVS